MINVQQITDVASQLKSELDESFRLSPESVCFLDVRRLESYFGVFSSDTLVALLSKGTCRLLHNLNEERVLQYFATIDPEQWGTILSERRKNPNSVLMKLDLAIYGSIEYSQAIGSILEKSKITLQKPNFDLGATTYVNPHYLNLGHSCQDDLLLSGLDIELINPSPEIVSGDDQAACVSAEVNSILDSLSHEDVLDEVEGDRRIKSRLLTHQKAAIDYVFKREMGGLPSELSLWEFNSNEEGAELRVYPEEYCYNFANTLRSYQHTISGSKLSQPEKATGGIIADEMGLGKSLVILSAIAGSLNRAAAFSSLAKPRCGRSDELSDEQEDRSPTGATLIEVPSSCKSRRYLLIVNPTRHIYPGGIVFYKHHGNKRKDYAKDLLKANIVFTTYATIAAEASRNNDAIAGMHWFRIVLDEAHDIRNRQTKQFHALHRLTAEHRWCLTGTPIQNSLDDLGSLVTFLRVPVLESASTFRRYISTKCDPIMAQDFDPLRQLLTSICLRRTREYINLPDPVYDIRMIELTDFEKNRYKTIIEESSKLIQMAVSKRGTRKLHTTVLQSLLRLRLFCNNGSSVFKSALDADKLPTDPDEILTYLQQRNEAICAYCSGNIYTINDSQNADGGLLMKGCMHLVCRGCMPQYHADKRECSQCASSNTEESQKTTLSIAQEQDGFKTNLTQPSAYPSKLQAFLSDVQKDRQGYTKHKSIAFSSWKKTLDIAGQFLSSQGIKFCCIHGSLSLSKRLKVLQEFRRPLGPDVLLMTMGTGAVGLNLAVASRIYLLEPQWNPSMELQAVGRALRLGQAEHVSIVRYIMRDTVEDSNVLSRQRRKLQLANEGFSTRRKRISSERLETLSVWPNLNL
ncbi:hypothetical protein K456DRAFT_1826169 [Colletotrichum gloeosporioides 23]|nr:hypothetical protein K456DRAFT_1826169 [Colletotrichum gloeosporioides 23]